LRRDHNGIGPLGGGFKSQTIVQLAGKMAGGWAVFFVIEKGTVGTQYKRFLANQRKKKA
jgi:hypothetical protein